METQRTSRTSEFDKRPLWRNLLSKDQRWVTRPSTVPMSVGKKLSLRNSSTVTVLKNRCLDNYTMEHNCQSAVSMLSNRRMNGMQKREEIWSEGDEFTREGQNKRKLFESTLNVKHEFPTCLKVVTIASPKSQREHSLAPQSDRQLLELTCSTRRRFNHARSTTLAYPEIQRHYASINAKFKVVCDAPTIIDEDNINTRDLSNMGPFFIVPQSTKTERVPEPEVEPEPELKEEAVVEVAESEVNSVNERSAAMSDDFKSTRPSLFQIPEPVETPFPTPVCWVDNATVTSSDHSDLVTQEPASTVTNGTLTATNNGPKSQNSETGIREYQSLRRRSGANSVPPESKRSSPHDKVALSDTPDAPSQSHEDNDQKHNYPETPTRNVSMHKNQLILKKVEEAIPENSIKSTESNKVDRLDETLERVEQEPVRQVEPPSYICPSSEKKSHDTEIRSWLKNSSFSSASKSFSLV